MFVIGGVIVAVLMGLGLSDSKPPTDDEVSGWGTGRRLRRELENHTDD